MESRQEPSNRLRLVRRLGPHGGHDGDQPDANWATFSLTPEQMEEVVQVKKLKGTDVVVTILLTNVGAKATPEEVTAGVEDTWEQVRLMREYWGWTDDADAAQIEAAIRKYANGLVDEVLKYGYTGLDLDYEPGLGSYHNGNIVMNQSQQGDIYAGTSPSQRTTWFVDECSKRLGPKSGSGKLLIVDGLVSSMPKETIECFDYYILQTYALTAQSSLDSYRLAGLVNAFGDIIDEETITNRTLVTENFELSPSGRDLHQFAAGHGALAACQRIPQGRHRCLPDAERLQERLLQVFPCRHQRHGQVGKGRNGS